MIVDRVVPMLLAPLGHRLHTAPKTFAHGSAVNRKPPPSAARTDVREAEKVKSRPLGRVGPARQCRATERQHGSTFVLRGYDRRRSSAVDRHLSWSPHAIR